MNHEDKCEAAKDAISEVFSDMDVSQGTIRGSLNDIIGHAKVMLDTIEE